MCKREVLLVGCILGLLLFSINAYAAPDAVVDIQPRQVYESTELEYNLSINNWGGSEVIDEVRVNMNGFNVTSITNYLGWEEFFENSIARWFNGDLENNVWGLFRFSARADLVDSNESKNIEIITKDEDGEETTDIIPVVIVNDDTAPEITNTVPCDGCFLREGESDQEVSADVEDDETGILNVSFSYWNCTNESSLESFVVLNCVGTDCTESIDVSSYEEGETMCFEFEAFNNALESSRVNGSVGFDGTPPEVTLVAPIDGSYASDNTEFSYIATDNLAPVMNCDFEVDSDIIETVNAANGAFTNTTYDFSNVTEGDHSWNVRCRDGVGLEGVGDERDIIVDKTAPTITLVSPENNSVLGDEVLIDIDVTDNYEVDTVGYSSSLNTSEMAEGENMIEVNASDKAGNTATETYVFTVDRTKPTLTIISPDDNATNDVHVSFEFNSTDNIDSEINCTVYIDGNAYDSVIVDGVASITTVLEINDYSWYVECVDDAGNSESSTPRDIHIVDLTGPDIVLEDIVTVARGEDYQFDADVTDPSGIDSVEALFNGDSLSLNIDGSSYSGNIITSINDTLGNYSLTINANDTLGNPSTLVEEFELVQGYAITLVVDPSTSEPSSSVEVLGTVTLDDGSEAPETEVVIYLPEEAVNVTLVNGSFSYTFDAPNSEGDYEIEVSVVSGDGHDHRISATLTVEAEDSAPVDVGSRTSSGSSASSSSSSGGESVYCGDGVCTTAGAANENCKVCPEDCGVCPITKTVNTIYPEVPEKDEFSGGYLLPEGEEIPEEDAREPSGIGQATGIFGGVIGSTLAWLLFLGLIAGLYYYSTKKKSKVNWNGYFKRK